MPPLVDWSKDVTDNKIRVFKFCQYLKEAYLQDKGKEEAFS